MVAQRGNDPMLLNMAFRVFVETSSIVFRVRAQREAAKQRFNVNAKRFRCFVSNALEDIGNWSVSALVPSDTTGTGACARAVVFCRDNHLIPDDSGRYALLALRTAEKFSLLNSQDRARVSLSGTPLCMIISSIRPST